MQPDTRISPQPADTETVPGVTTKVKDQTQAFSDAEKTSEQQASFAASNELIDVIKPSAAPVSADQHLPATDQQAGNPATAAEQSYLAQQSASRVVFVDAGVTDYTALINKLQQTDAGTGAAGSYNLYTITATTEDHGGEDGNTFVLTPVLFSPIDNASLGNDDVSAGVSAGTDTSAIVIILNQNFDGIDQMSQILDQCNGISEVHIISHGAAGLLTLGSTQLNKEELENRMAEMSAWKQALTSDADVFLYGCNVAAGEAGIDFIKTLTALTGADVAASTDATGNADKGGDWVLEYTTGVIETEPLFMATLSDYRYLLEDHVTTTANETLSGGDGNDAFIFSDNWGTDTVTDSGTTGIDKLDFSAVTADLTFTIQADGKVSVTAGSNKLNPVAGMEKLIGGKAVNLFVFEDGAIFGGTIVGGSGTNTLDYSAYTTAIAVNLGTGTATGTSGISNISRIIGSTQNDTLTGNANANYIDGKAGNDIITGGGGNDTLIGGLGDDTFTLADVWG